MFIPMRNSRESYGGVAQLLHWTVVALVVVQFSLGFSAEGLPISLQRLVLLSRHKSVGMTILALALLRLVWRVYSPPPPPLPADMSRLQRFLARGSHALLYALLLAIPLAGWITSSASHLTVTWFGLFSFPNLVGPNLRVAHIAKALHFAMARMLLVVACLHAVAAGWHQWWRKDGVLSRMLPLWKRT